MLPSPTAAATRFTGLNRTSPQAKMPGRARFEQEGIAVVRPAPGLHHVVTGQDIPSIIARDVRRQPLRLRVGANEDEKAAAVVPAHSLLRAVADVDRGQVGVAMRGDDFRARPNAHVRLGPELLDQIARHAPFQRITAHEQRHRARMIGKEQGGLAGGISRPDEVDVEAVRGAGFAARRAVVDALADQPIKPVDRESAPRYARGKDDGPAPHDVVAIEANLTRRRIESGHGARDQYLRPKPPCLLERAACSSSPDTPLGKPR